MAEVVAKGAIGVVTEVVVELGETNLWVTLCDDGAASSPVLVQGGAPGQFPAHLSVTADGQWSWGADERLGDAEILVSGFLSRVNDPVPVVVGHTSVPAADLVARQVAALLSILPTNRPPRRVTLIHPVDLSRPGRRAVEAQLRARVPFPLAVSWRSRAEAAVRALPECSDLAPDELIGVLHVGGATSEAAVWQGPPIGGHASPAQVDWGYAGSAADDALVCSIIASEHRARMRRLCAQAKERLSSETAVDISLDGVPRRIVRSEVEELTERLTNRQLDTLAAALSRAGASSDKLRLLLLVGGAGAAPYLVEAASDRFEVPVLSVPRLAAALPVERPAAQRSAVAARPTQDATETSPSPASAQTPTPAVTTLATPKAKPAKTPATTPPPRPPKRVVVPVLRAWSGDSRTRVRGFPLPSATHLAVAAAALAALAAGVPTALERAQSGGDTAAVSDAPQALGPALSGNGGLGQLLPGDANAAPAAGSVGQSAYQVPEWLSGGSITTTTLGRNQLVGAMKSAAGDTPSDGAPQKGRDTGTAPSKTSSSPAAKASASSAAPSSGGSAAPAAGSGSTPIAGSGSTPSSSPVEAPSSSSSSSAPAPAPETSTSSSSTPAPSPSTSDSPPPSTQSDPPSQTSEPSTQSSPPSTENPTGTSGSSGGQAAVEAEQTASPASGGSTDASAPAA